ncbi:MAG: VOC family protein [Chloroflexota bacterium]|nr:MAG: VOC family protein [Chloroflexota bacterium]
MVKMDFPAEGMALTHILDEVSHAMTIRVPDCQVAYDVLRARGADFLTPPTGWGGEVRCFFRDPDGHLLEISEAR